MAKPIQLDFPARDYRAELQKRLADAPAEHAEAIVEFLELLQVLHERNVLTTLRGVVGAGDGIVTSISAAAAQPESVRAIRNLLALSRILSRIDPELLAAIERSMPGGAAQAREKKAPGVGKIARLWFSASVRRSLFATGFVLAGIGDYLERRRAA